MAALDRDRWRCQKCGKAGILEVHHIKPLEDGGKPYDLSNTLTLCRGDHIRIHGGTPHTPDPGYAALIQGMLYRISFLGG